VRFLKKHHLPFKAINIGNNAGMMERLALSTGWKTVPKIFVQGQFIGGFSELMKMAESGELEHRLRQPMS